MENHIKQIIDKTGLSRREFAQKLGITYAAVSHYIYGIRKPNLSICYRIIDLAKKYKFKIKLEDIHPRSD